MKNIVLIVFFIVNVLQAKEVADRLYLFANSSENQIELKWFTQKYSSKYTYKIYRGEYGKESKFLHTVKPIDYKVLKSEGYSDDYIFMIYPHKDIKNIDDMIQVAQIEGDVQGFRMLKFMKDKAFAKNLGQYFADMSVKKNRLYVYTVFAYRGKKMVFQRSIMAHSYKMGKRYDFMWAQAKIISKGVALNWDVQSDYSYYNIYRKRADESKFYRVNKIPVFISKKYAQKSRTLYLDRDVKNGDSFTYYIKRVDMFGKEGEPSDKFKVKLEKKKRVKPSKVKDIFVVISDKKIKLVWSKSYNILGYNVYRSKIYQGNFRKINKKIIKKELFFDKNFEVGKNYYYYVTAVNMYGESLPSTTILAYARDTTKPHKPTKLKASIKAGEVTLKWSGVKDRDLIGYRVYLSMDEDAKHWSMLNKNVIKKPVFIHKRSKTLSRFPYYYRVTAVDSTYNESFPSNIVKVKLPDVTAPRQPFITSFRAYSSRIILEWNRIDVYDFSHYNIYRKLNKKYLKLNKKPILNRVFIDNAPKNGINEYVITAVDKSGNESKKSKTKLIELKDITPVKITDFKLSKTKNGIKATFSCKDKDYAGFKLFRSSGDIIKYFNVSNFVKSKSFIDTTVSEKTEYFYMIKAYDKAGNISESKVLHIKLK